jgi:hypothetical protein
MTTTEPEQHALVFAIAHEIGNHLGAIRMQAHLLGLDEEPNPRALASASIELDSLAGRGAPLLALLRPILAPEAALGPSTTSSGVTWSSLLEGLHRQIENDGTRGIRVDFVSPSEAQTESPGVDWLAPLLMALVGSTLDSASDCHTIVLRLDERDREARLVIEDDASEEDLSPEAPLRGRPLCVSIARRLMAAFGGQVETRRVGGSTQIEFVFPARS